MSFMNTMNSWKSNLLNEVAKFKNSSFLEAACATSCLIAAADGSIDPEEKRKTLDYMQLNESLKVFDTTKVVTTFQKFADTFAFDPGMGQDACFVAIDKIKENPEAARACVRLGCVIGAADGDFDADEKAMVKKIAERLGLNASEFIS